MGITLQLETEDNLRINKETGGLEEARTDPLRQLPLVESKETDPKELSLLHSSPSRERTSRF